MLDVSTKIQLLIKEYEKEIQTLKEELAMHNMLVSAYTHNIALSTGRSLPYHILIYMYIACRIYTYTMSCIHIYVHVHVHECAYTLCVQNTVGSICLVVYCVCI